MVCGASHLRWHRGKAGTVEQTLRVLRDERAAGVCPSGRLGANAAWLRLQVVTYNLLGCRQRRRWTSSIATFGQSGYGLRFAATSGQLCITPDRGLRALVSRPARPTVLSWLLWWVSPLRHAQGRL